jgi:hypothetical protein
MELPFAGLHQLCAPRLDGLALLPEPQGDALSTVFGVRDGSPPNRYLVGLATLTLLGEAAVQRPLLCIVDDVQWLDHASAQALAFVARRLLADSVGLLFCSREQHGDLAGLPGLVMKGLGPEDARALLRSVPGAPLDAQVIYRIVAEAHGNPLAVLEWHRAPTPAKTGRETPAPGRRVALGANRGELPPPPRRALGRYPSVLACLGGRAGRRP